MTMNKINYLPPKYSSFEDTMNRLYPEKVDKESNVAARTITFQVTEDCCMKCTYCYQNNKSKNKMTFETAKKFIDDLLNDKYECINSKNTHAIVFDFIGGEPLMEIELIEQICDYLILTMIKLNHPWLYLFKISIGSNGLLYNTSKVQNFFNKYKNLIGFTISIDGNQELHDACRIDLNGEGTYNRAIDAVRQYRKQYGQMPSTKMTISPENVKYLFNAVINLINEGYNQILLNCVYEDVWNLQHANILYYQLKLVADYLIENNLYNKILIRMFEENNFKPMKEEDNRNWCGGVENVSLAINHTGNFYPCIRYMESSLNNKQQPIIVGDIKNGYGSIETHKENIEKISNITRRSQSTNECFNCPIAQGCGWCSAYNYEVFGTVNKRTTFTCDTHKAESLANVYYWNTLYQYLGINKIFEMHIPKEWALEIIDEDEYNYLLNLIEKGKIKNE